MRHLSSALLTFSAAMLLLSGCRTTSGEGEQASGQPPSYMTDAVLRSFEDMCDGSWGGVTVYIQKSAWIPEDLKQAGKNPVQITTIRELIKMHRDADVAPAIAIVDAGQTQDGVIKVTIRYTPVKIKGLEPSTRGGSFEYTYMMLDGKLVMLSRLKPLLGR
ncbi:MAG: hypothetical protein WCL44_04635 [bacterium]